MVESRYELYQPSSGLCVHGIICQLQQIVQKVSKLVTEPFSCILLFIELNTFLQPFSTMCSSSVHESSGLDAIPVLVSWNVDVKLRFNRLLCLSKRVNFYQISERKTFCRNSLKCTRLYRLNHFQAIKWEKSSAPMIFNLFPLN